MNQVKNRSFTYIVVQKKNLGLINEILSYKIRHCLISEKVQKKTVHIHVHVQGIKV